MISPEEDFPKQNQPISQIKPGDGTCCGNTGLFVTTPGSFPGELRYQIQHKGSQSSGLTHGRTNQGIML